MPHLECPCVTILGHGFQLPASASVCLRYSQISRAHLAYKYSRPKVPGCEHRLPRQSSSMCSTNCSQGCLVELSSRCPPLISHFIILFFFSASLPSSPTLFLGIMPRMKYLHSHPHLRVCFFMKLKPKR